MAKQFPEHYYFHDRSNQAKQYTCKTLLTFHYLCWVVARDPRNENHPPAKWLEHKLPQSWSIFKPHYPDYQNRQVEIVFPKIMVPPNHPILIGFFIINHPFWGFSPYLWKHPFLCAMINAHRTPCTQCILLKPSLVKQNLLQGQFFCPRHRSKHRWKHLTCKKPPYVLFKVKTKGGGRTCLTKNIPIPIHGIGIFTYMNSMNTSTFQGVPVML